MADKKPQNLAKLFGANLVKRRQLLGMSQVDLANRLGVAPDALSRIENGFVAPRFGRIEELAKILDCSVAELFRVPQAESQSNAVSLADIIHPLASHQQEEVIQLVAQFVRLLRKG